MINEMEIKKQICEIGRRIYNRNMVAANDGNISVKLNDNEFLCTPTGVSKGFMTPEFICKVDKNGNVIQANKGFKPSSEIKKTYLTFLWNILSSYCFQYNSSSIICSRGSLHSIYQLHKSITTRFCISNKILSSYVKDFSVCKSIRCYQLIYICAS